MSQESDLDALIERYLQASEEGQPLDEATLLAENPNLAEELSEFFAMHHEARSAFCIDPPSIPRGSLSDASSSQASLGPTFLHSGSSAASAWSWNRIASAEFPIEFGPYQLLEEINRGGMGVVYRAVHNQLQRMVALKVMRAGDLATAEEVQRFRTEAIASSALNHPNIIPIFEAGEEHGLFYFTMAFIDGEDLDSRLKHQPIQPRDIATILLKMTEAVAYAHRKNVIHRDIKPSNILLDSAQEPFLADFGLAHLLATEDGVTMTGQILGTPSYMPPEQASGRVKQLTPSIDIYSLGAVLYTGLTRQPPFSGPTPFDVLLQVIDRQPPKPSQLNRQCPRDLEAICLKAMSKDAADRYASADEMANDLRCFLRGEPVKIDQPTLWQRTKMWWRREPILVSHLAAVLAVACIMVAAYSEGESQVSPERFGMKLGIVLGWGAVCVFLQYLARFNRHQQKVYLVWASADVIIYTTLMFLADQPRGLLMVGYPMMIAASGLFYRVRFVVYMTIVCLLSMTLLTFLVDDPMRQRIDFFGIYLSGLVILALCVVTMIRRIRGLSRYCGASE